MLKPNKLFRKAIVMWYTCRHFVANQCVSQAGKEELSRLPCLVMCTKFQSFIYCWNIGRLLVYINLRGALCDYVRMCVLRETDTVRLQLVQCNPGVRTCSYVRKLMIGSKHENDLIGLLETLKDTGES